MGVRMSIKLMKVSKYLSCEADVALITTNVVSIFMVIKLVFCFKSLFNHAERDFLLKMLLIFEIF